MNKDLHNPAGVTAESLGPHHKLLTVEELNKPLPEGAEYWDKGSWRPSESIGCLLLEDDKEQLTYRIPLTLSDRLKAEQRKHWDEKEELIRVVEAVEKGSAWEQYHCSDGKHEIFEWFQPADQSVDRLDQIIKLGVKIRRKPAAPTPQTIPWTLESHPDVVCVKKKDRKGAEESHRQITRWYSDRAFIEDYGFITYQELHSDWLQRNGEPCGTPA